MKIYTFAFDPWGFEREVTAESHKEARKIAWEGLSDSQRDNCESFDCVDVRDAATRLISS